jgi:hypothetical protein
MDKKLAIIYLSIILNLLAFNLTAQTKQKKEIRAVRINESIQIDGVLDEISWELAPAATDFIQYAPHNGMPASFPSEVKFLYDNEAIYVGAMLYDPNPDSIYTELSERDEIEMVDYFGVYFDPFNDYLTAYGFFVTAAGVQVDKKSVGSEPVRSFDYTGGDESWDAVWQSSLRIVDSGWIVELKIPYSALRFPKNYPDQTWGLQIFRNITRYRESTSWNMIDRGVDGLNNQAGLLKGLEDIKPPVRLSVTPYLAGYLEKSPEIDNWATSLHYGLDLKYGISESFTLDLTLIPDFGQVQSDDKIYNLSPFEVYYGERRPFFTEGTELFNKGDVFYSRRVGDQPSGYNEVESQTDTNEIIKENPTETQLINATKFSGKTRKGLGIGVFNAMTANTYATIQDTITGETREYRTDPFTNYNMVVLDQSLKNNSFVSLFNTNVYKPDNDYSANVTGTDFKVTFRDNTYAIRGQGIVTQKYNKAYKPELGYKYAVNMGKISGNFTFNLNQILMTDMYDPNDMGFNTRNNTIEDNLDLAYNIYKPFWIVLDWYNSIRLWYDFLYQPREFTSTGFKFSSRTTLKNYLSAWLNITALPVPSYDFFEPRVEGWKFKNPASFNFDIGLSPDYRKRFVIDLRSGIEHSKEYEQFNYWFDISPRIRFSDKLFVTYKFVYSNYMNNIGYVTDSLATDGSEVIIFGNRNIENFENVFRAVYRFGPLSSVSFRMRHYWLTGIYNQYYDLQEDGELENNDYEQLNDFSYNTFTIDMVFRWNFAPGSELNLIWKNTINTFDNFPEPRFTGNLEEMFSSAATNSFSIKLLYYFDYLYLKRKNKISE